MVNFSSIVDKAKELVGKRGGTESLKEDAAEVKDIATGEGSVTDKAKAAVEAVKEPGAGEPEGRPDATEPKGERRGGGEHRRRDNA
jgi:hypothetical protein